MGSRRLLTAAISGWPGVQLVGTQLSESHSRGLGACLGLESWAVKRKESSSVIIRARTGESSEAKGKGGFEEEGRLEVRLIDGPGLGIGRDSGKSWVEGTQGPIGGDMGIMSSVFGL